MNLTRPCLNFLLLLRGQGDNGVGMSTTSTHITEIVEQIYRQEAGRVLAGLISHLRDFDLAEDVLQEAFIMALKSWPKEGLPNNPGAWLAVTARRKAIDRLRRNSTLAKKTEQLQNITEHVQEAEEVDDAEVYTDERLKLIFTCCHPALALDARVALTLRTLGGLTTTEIASAFLTTEVTMAQRLVRAKKKIKDAGIPYQVPPAHLIAERVSGVLAVIYLIFNEGYNSRSGEALIRHELCTEAIRLARALNQLITQESSLSPDSEALGLLALMLLNDSRRKARLSPEGELVLLEEQDRTLWDKKEIQEGLAILDKAMALKNPGPYQLQAAIAALHAQAATPEDTDWLQIAVLYSELLQYHPSPVIELNRAVAIAMADGPFRGLALLKPLEASGLLVDYYLFYAAKADLLRRADNFEEAAAYYKKALALTQNPVEHSFLQRRLAELE